MPPEQALVLGCECLKFEGSEKQRIKKELVFF
jgi:hypothetical protein